MRIAHLLRKYDPVEWGGTETAIQRLTTGLAATGGHSVVYAPELAHAPMAPDPLVLGGCVVRRFRARVPVWGISEAQKREMVAVGGNVISFDLMRGLWRARKSFDVIHSHALGRLGATGHAVAHGAGLPFVISVHGGAYDLPAAVRRDLGQPAVGGFDWGRPIGLLLRARHLFDESDAIITVNAREAALIRERHPHRRVVVQAHGVPAADFARDQRERARAAFPMISGRSVMLVLGRIDATKNQEWLVAQTLELARRHPRALVVLAGACMNPEYGEALQASVVRDGLQQHVLFTGNLPPGDPRLIGLLQEARAVVLPSVSETFGIVILEAWAAGTPVISSRTSGATALVDDGVNGVLFELTRPETFHAAVDRLLVQPAWRDQMGAAGQTKVIAQHDTAVLARETRRLYEELIEEKNAHRHPARR